MQIENDLEFVMPFGEFKGKELEEIPMWYIKWLAEECHVRELQEKADRVYWYRKKFDLY